MTIENPEIPRPYVQSTVVAGVYDLANVSPATARALLEQLPASPHREVEEIIECLRYIAASDESKATWRS